MILSNSTFSLFGAKHYINPHCQGMDEFEEDLKRVIYVRKLLTKYRTSGTLKDRLILNHIVVLYNCFGLACTPMLMMKCEGLHPLLKPFLQKLSLLPAMVTYADKEIDTSVVESDATIEKRLREI